MIVIVKPFEKMSLAELRAEHAEWVKATRAGGWGALHENAHICRDTMAVWIARREREAQEAAAAAIGDGLALGDIDAEQARRALRAAGIDPSEIDDHIDVAARGAAQPGRDGPQP